MILLFLMNPDRYFFCVLSAAALHEAGHLFAARAAGTGIAEMRLGISGAVIIPEGSLSSYGSDAAVAFWGAGANILGMIAAALIYRVCPCPEMICFFFANLFLGAFNLVPAPGSDGALLLYSLVARSRGQERAERVREKAGRISLALTAAFSLWLLLELKNASVTLILLGRITDALSPRFGRRSS